VKTQYVAVDLHRRRSLIVRDDHLGHEVAVVRIENDPLTLAKTIADAGDSPEVAIEATNGWYWAVDVLQDCGANVHPVHPKGLNWEGRRVKNDYRDCRELLDRLEMGKLPESWISTHEVRELRELVRYRLKLVHMRTSAKAQVKAVLIKLGVRWPVNDLWGPGGENYLDHVALPDAYRLRVESLRDLVRVFNQEIAEVQAAALRRVNDDAGYRAIQAISGVGPVLGALFVAEIGDVGRFSSAQHLCSWAGLTPKHRESDDKVYRGSLTKQGSVLVRWAAIEAISTQRGGPRLQASYHRIAERRGRNIARTAAARKLLTLVYYGLRDGHVRCLEQVDEAG
jgi:transposase